MTAARQTVCLCMIVRNEAEVIARCLDSVRALIDCWLIVDTGSDDATRDIVRARLADLPGTLVERPWVDFGHNRSEALALARDRADYSLIIDADDTIETEPGFVLPSLSADVYLLRILDQGTLYWRRQLVRNTLPWRFRGVLHEFITTDAHAVQATLDGVTMRRNHDGARRRDPATYMRDAATLFVALETEQDPLLRTRYTFYLAQSWRDCGQAERALAAYLERAEMGGWDEEIYVSLLNAARLQQQTNAPSPKVFETYLRAIAVKPERAEALHGASVLCRLAGRHEEAYQLALRGVGLTPPPLALFVEQWIYEYALLDELAVSAYMTGRVRETADACIRLLVSDTAPAAERPRYARNAQAALMRLGEPAPDPAARQSAFVGGHDDLRPRDLRTRPAAWPRVLITILAKQKEPFLELFLRCIEDLDYPKARIALHIRTNDNTDRTETLLRDWVARVGAAYASVEFDATNTAEDVSRFPAHEWNPIRFRVLGRIREASLARAAALGCDFVFVPDCDNVVVPGTLKELVALDLPIVAPFLRHIDPDDRYSNFHADVDGNGYFVETPRYDTILRREITGVIEVALVHATYLVRADVIPELGYQDGTTRHEYVIFADKARRAGIPQYLDTRRLYGYVLFDGPDRDAVASRVTRASTLLYPVARPDA